MSFQEPKFFLNPVLIGPSVYSRLRLHGSAAYLLGPSSGSDIVTVPSANIEKAIKDLNTQAMPHEDLKGFYGRCNAILAHQGVPLKVDSPSMLLTADAADTITTIVQKVNATEKMYPNEGVSDLYIRVGVVYWRATQGVLFKTSSKKWRDEKRSYLASRAKEYLSKVAPGDDLYSIAARDLGMLCLAVEEWTEAEEHLSDAFRHFPNDIRIGEGLARAHLMLGNQVEALSHVDDAINLSETAELWVLKGKIMKDMDRYEEALSCFNRALAIDPRYIPAHDALIDTLRDIGRLEEAALAESQRALTKRPGLERKIAELISEFKKAAVEEKPAVPVSGPTPKRPEPKAAPPVPAELASIASAKEALRTKDWDLAIQRAGQLLKQDARMKDAALILIEALFSKGDLAAASSRAHSYYEKNREDPLAWYWRGAIAAKEDKWGASIQYLSKAVALDPKLVGAWVLMGEVLLGHDKASGADESFSRALETDSGNARAWLGKGRAMKKLGRWGAAIQCLDKYNLLEPSDRDSWLLKADTLFEKEKYERAIDAYDKYLELSQPDSYVLGRKGIALYQIGNFEDARKALEESVRLDPSNKEAAKWLKTMTQGGGA